METKRYIWVDNVKVIAIALVVIGHMIMGFPNSGIIPIEHYPQHFISVLYLFHVPLFFICSGFLYQRLTKTQHFKDYVKNIAKKLLALGIPYFVFSGVAYFLKEFFSASVNNQNQTSFLHSLFITPAAPYWFLYALFLLFFNPIFKSKVTAVLRLVAAAALYVAYAATGFSFMPELLREVCGLICNNAVWFLLGMAVAFFNGEKAFRKSGLALFLLFLALAAAALHFQLSFPGLGLLLGSLACAGIISFIGKCYASDYNSRIFAFLAKYTTPIFLMHTIFAAAVRSLLLHFGILNLPLHVAAGLLASFALPVLAAFIMEMLRLDFFYQPTKYIKIN